jgi:hypothetical protein
MLGNLKKIEFESRGRVSFLVRCYLINSAIWFKMPEKIGQFWRAIWLGILDSASLNEITWFLYENASDFDNEEFNLHQGFWQWELEAIRKYFPSQGRILIAGAGGGREVIAMTGLGFDVTAFDFSDRLTKACCKNLETAGCKARILNAPPNSLPEGLGVFDGIIVGRGFYHHIPGRKRRLSFLVDCWSHLDSEAPILISDFFIREPISRKYMRIQSNADFIRRIRFSSERVELGDWLTNAFQHAFTKDEIENELMDAYFRQVYYFISPFGPDSHLAHVLGRK